MTQPKNLMEVYTLLDKSNCRDCGEKTCMAFAAAVFKGARKLSECTHLDPKQITHSANDAPDDSATNEQPEDLLLSLQQQIAKCDLAMLAPQIGGVYADGRLTLKVLGKNVRVDSQGQLTTDIHINPWLAQPVLTYILQGSDLTLANQWVSFRELGDGSVRYPLFKKRCEEAMQHVADVYTDLFDDMVHLFNGRRVTNHYQADITVALHPLPKMPILICYWKPEDGLASSLNIFFDAHADKILDIGAIFTLCAGMARMFEKLAERHGFVVDR